MKFSDKERAFSVEVYLRTGSFKESMSQFKKHYKVRKSPSRQRIAEWTSKFRENGSVQDQNRGKSGRLRTARSEDNINAIRESVKEAPEMILRRLLLTGIQLSTSSAWRILKKDLRVKPYTISMAHKLNAYDMVQREEMCVRFSD